MRGTPSTSATALYPNVDWSGVCLNSLLSATCGTASRFSSTWIRIPVRSEWSARSEISVSVLSPTSSAILRMTPVSPPFLTPYGSSVITIADLPPRSSSMWARARITIRPRPVRYASRIPLRPTTKAPVGKSGPLTCFIRPSTLISGSSIIATTALIASPRWCGGMFVAIPTAMPAEPLTSRFGKREGRTSGSRRDSS